MIRRVEDILRRYGQEVILVRRGEEAVVRAFLQPIRQREELEPETAAPIGWLDGRLWLYLGREAAEAGDEVLWSGWRFRVRSGRPHYIGDRLCHRRAVLERARETE